MYQDLDLGDHDVVGLNLAWMKIVLSLTRNTYLDHAQWDRV
jgi:hypothetical protein